MSEYRQKTEDIEKLLSDLKKRQVLMRDFIMNKKISKELFESDLSWQLYESTRLSAVGIRDMRNMLKSSERNSVLALALSTMAIVLSIVLK